MPPTALRPGASELALRCCRTCGIGFERGARVEREWDFDKLSPGPVGWPPRRASTGSARTGRVSKQGEPTYRAASIPTTDSVDRSNLTSLPLQHDCEAESKRDHRRAPNAAAKGANGEGVDGQSASQGLASGDPLPVRAPSDETCVCRAGPIRGTLNDAAGAHRQ